MADSSQKIRADRIRETTNSTGTGTYVLTGAGTGFKTFASVCPDGSIVDYGVTEVNGPAWENGVGQYSTATNSIARLTIYDSSNNNLPMNWTTQSKQIFMTMNGASITALTDDTILNVLILG